MKVSDIAVALYEALQDNLPCAVEIQPIKAIDREYEEYYLRIDGRRHKVSQRIADNAIRWQVPTKKLATEYRIANVKLYL